MTRTQKLIVGFGSAIVVLLVAVIVVIVLVSQAVDRQRLEEDCSRWPSGSLERFACLELG